MNTKNFKRSIAIAWTTDYGWRYARRSLTNLGS
jgi:hypothetical protein